MMSLLCGWGCHASRFGGPHRSGHAQQPCRGRRCVRAVPEPFMDLAVRPRYPLCVDVLPRLSTTERTPATLAASCFARSLSGAEPTVPLRVTTESLVATPICNERSPGSARIAAFTFAVRVASSIASAVLFAASLVAADILSAASLVLAAILSAAASVFAAILSA